MPLDYLHGYNDRQAYSSVADAIPDDITLKICRSWKRWHKMKLLGSTPELATAAMRSSNPRLATVANSTPLANDSISDYLMNTV